MEKQIDMTQGPILQKAVRFALPICAGNILQQLYGTVDTLIIGNFCGASSLAAVATSGQPMELLLCIFLGTGSGVFSGQNLGVEHYLRLRKGIWQIPLFSGAVSLAAGVTVTLFCRPPLALFTQDGDVLETGVRYIRLILPFYWNYAVFNGIMSFVNGMGNIRYTTAVNILLLWVVRIPTAYLLSWLGYGGYIMASMPVSFAVGMIAMLFYFRTRHWAEICALARREPEYQLQRN